MEEKLPSAAELAALLPEAVRGAHRPVQRYEWRPVGEERVWMAYPNRQALPVLVDGATGAVLERLTPQQARVAGEMVVAGVAVGPAEESEEYWMDANTRVPTYLFRFADPDDTDVHVSQHTGEVVQRRPAIWRAFGPFLAYHTFGFTGNPWLDTLLLTGLQALLVAMMWSGWRLAVRSPRAEARS